MKKILASLVSLFIFVCCVANNESTTSRCSTNSNLDLQKINLKPIQLNNQPTIKSDIVTSDDSIGYTFPAKAGQKINYQTTSNVCIQIFDSKYQQINQNFLPQDGIYTLQVYAPQKTTNFDIEISLDISPISPFQKDNHALTYNSSNTPDFEYDQKLKTIVDKIVAFTKRRGKSSEDKSYARDFNIFPQISKLVFEAMKIRSRNDTTTFTFLPQSRIPKFSDKYLDNPPNGL